MGATAVYKWPWPEDPVVADGPDAIGDLALAIESEFVSTSWLSYIPSWASTGTYQPSNPRTIEGKYRLWRGWCDINIWVDFNASTFGGTGGLIISMPQAGHPALEEQYLPAKTWLPGYGQFNGSAYVNGGASFLWIEFPKSLSTCLMAGWQNQSDGGGVGTGVPQVPGSNPVFSGGNLSISGRFKVA